ncbi:vinorine synthase-like [Herrania umbratica]|uniref:Vinorine synthase-like n=1 Tax=Herrania umbratica TaxID=108875 RepID=A0A6J1A8C5_9ROSI|nr:vinorine synthase-like [Herrania umbratica]
MEVQIISRETIKPSSPTPHHLRTHKLCLFDQLTSPTYIPTLLFYSARDGSPRNCISDNLKKSLSKALTHFYPLAGRIKDGLTIDCNDNGATFVEAQVARDISFVVEEPEIEVLQQLLPCDPLRHLPQTQPSTDQVLLAVQVNHFACGGVAICVCISHVVADAAAAANFLRGWAEVACGANIIEGVIYDCSSLFPPRDISLFYRVMGILNDKNNVGSPADKVITKRFFFDGSKIAALRNEMGDELNSYHPTRIEAVTALIWEALIAATAENVITTPTRAASNTVNLRKRMNPPLPPQCIGNACFFAMVSTPIENIENRTSLASKIRESIKEVDDDYIRRIFTGDGCFHNLMEKTFEEFEKSSNIGLFSFSSWCRFPFYETNFGWGKPIWFGTTMRTNRTAYFIDTSDGEGIEAWISLTKGEMAKLDQEPGILAYATFKLSI